MTDRACPKCGVAIGIDDDRCWSCGANTPVTYPWYIWPLGFLIIAALFALLVDLDAFWRTFGHLFEAVF